MTDKEEAFIDMIEFALDWGFKPSKKQMDRYFDLIQRRKLNAMQSKRAKGGKQTENN